MIHYKIIQCGACGKDIKADDYQAGRQRKYCNNACTQLACRIRRAERKGEVYNISGKVGRPSITAANYDNKPRDIK